MKMRYQLTIHFDSLQDIAAIMTAVSREVEDNPPDGTVGMVAEQVHTFDPTEDGGG